MIRRTKRFRRNLKRLSDVTLWIFFAIVVALTIDALLAYCGGHVRYLDRVRDGGGIGAATSSAAAQR